MKTIITILFLCSAAVGQQAAVVQSAQPVMVGSATFNIEASRSKTFTVVDGAKKILEINTDTGEVTYGTGVTVTEASHKFYEEVGKLFGNKPCDAKAGAKPDTCRRSDEQIIRDALTFKEDEPTTEKPRAGAVSAPCGSGDSGKPEKK